MHYQVFSENEWLYPDTEINIGADAPAKVSLFGTRNADVCFQVLTDLVLTGKETFRLHARNLSCTCQAYQLLPAHVEENSGEKLYTTLDYDSVKHFVTRRAPFDVYDITRPIEDGTLWAGRAAFFLRLNIPQNAAPGVCEGSVLLEIGEETLSVPVSLKVYQTAVPDLPEASFHMVNWIYYEALANQFGEQAWSDAYYTLLGRHLENQLDMRNDCLMLPSGTPVRDAQGQVVDFDFSHAAKVGNLALRMGFRYVFGGFSAHWNAWDDPELYLLWNREIGVSSQEGYRQLRLYFDRAQACVQKNDWGNHYMQCLVDEPQFQNSAAYRALSCICRSRMPGVKINDPVECTELGGAVDVWAVKQAVYEKYIDVYQKLQSLGEEMWLYTCGFPAGATMNRVLDLPLTVSRLPMWMCFRYRCPGFLHYGYAGHEKEVEKRTCTVRKDGMKLPPGNSFIVYPARDGGREPWYSVRGHLQRLGACDYELFALFAKKVSFQAADALIAKICTGFDQYRPSAALLDSLRHELLERLG